MSAVLESSIDRNLAGVDAPTPSGCGNLELDPAFCWQAVYSRDPRFDGRFFAGNVERVVREATAEKPREAAPLPAWPGHAPSALRREDLYDDLP